MINVYEKRVIEYIVNYIMIILKKKKLFKICSILDIKL